MKNIQPEAMAAAITRLARRAETMLPPDVVMKIECTADAEPPGSTKEALYVLLDRVVDCGLNDKPLFSRRASAHVFVRVGDEYRGASVKDAAAPVLPDASVHTETVKGRGLSLRLALFDPEYEGLSETAPYSGDTKEFLEFIIKSARRKELKHFLPAFVGAGAGKSAAEALFLARRAILRPMDKENPDITLKRLEIRARSKINRLSSDEGAGTIALAVHIECGDSPRYCAALFSPPALRRAELCL